MKVAYVTIADPADPHAWSGINHTLRRLIARGGAEVLPVGPLRSPFAWVAKARTALSRLMPGKPARYLWSLDSAVLRDYGRLVNRQLERLRPDVVFSPGTQPIAHLADRWPTVFWTDAPFGAMRNYYSWYKEVSPVSVRNGLALDNLALLRCRAACYSSDWAAGAAVAEHGADPSRVHVLPFGANLEYDASPDHLPAAASKRLGEPWRFLFVGVEWERKGGDLALSIVRALNEAGHPSELVVAGCHPPARCEPLPPYVRVEGFISQHTAEGRRRLSELFESALFYLMPSRAEAYGIVFCEASAHGVPSLSTRTGGIPTIVRDGENGRLFALDAAVGEYVEFILCHTDPTAYLSLARSSFEAYRTRLDWNINQPRLLDLLAQAVRPAASSREAANASYTPSPA